MKIEQQNNKSTITADSIDSIQVTFTKPDEYIVINTPSYTVRVECDNTFTILQNDQPIYCNNLMWIK